jgi:hypothetical protein
MVRREEQPWDSRATVVLDVRADAHAGEGPTASFEWAVSAAASIAMHLRQAGYKVRLVTGSGVDVDATEIGGDGVILDTLADVKLVQNCDIPVLVEQVRRRSDGGLVIGLFGTLSVAGAELLSGLRGNGATCIGFAIDSSTWVPATAAERQESDLRHSDTALSLVRSGWRSVAVVHGDSLPALWPVAARGSTGFARRAAMAETVAGVRR